MKASRSLIRDFGEIENLQVSSKGPGDFVTSADRRTEKIIINECQRLAIDLVIIGPEDPLAEGLANKMREAGLTVFGPGKDGAQLEASKDWSKALMIENNIPTAKYWSAKSKEEALEILRRFNQPLVIKADGLAAGKGVTVCDTIEESEEAIKDIFSGKFGSAGNKVILEEKIDFNNNISNNSKFNKNMSVNFNLCRVRRPIYTDISRHFSSSIGNNGNDNGDSPDDTTPGK